LAAVAVRHKLMRISTKAFQFLNTVQKPCDYIIPAGCLKVNALPFKEHRYVIGVMFSRDRVASILVVWKQKEKQKDYGSSSSRKICSYV